ncbi:hypothetical protein [Nocardia sp. NRRL S-836]|uniref:hypothetical protein n=1 Tax=Nocardia sp. NRRL S-836 TaxID=1519492 RepID=UPI0006C0FF08|nr:hypothetical protein [Nocardia sp. NRRL S-836]KOV79652.1 hypothetical protein ADL03_36535 [Nocardia sp. NRRL S-836]
MTATRTMQADADIVFNTASDDTRALAWLPPSLRTCEIVVNTDERTLEWRRNDEQCAYLRVEQGGAGTSEVELRLPDDTGGDDALRALEAEVAENFTAG